MKPQQNGVGMMINPCNKCLVNPICIKGCDKLAEYLKDVIETGYYWEGGNVPAIHMAEQIRNGRFELVGKIVRRKKDKATMKIHPNEIEYPKRFGL